MLRKVPLSRRAPGVARRVPGQARAGAGRLGGLVRARRGARAGLPDLAGRGCAIPGRRRRRARGDLPRRRTSTSGCSGWSPSRSPAAQAAARAAGMPIGIVADLAIGAHPGGADAWAGQDVYAPGFTVGAPPDAFNQRGQDWALPPPHPGGLPRSPTGRWRTWWRRPSAWPPTGPRSAGRRARAGCGSTTSWGCPGCGGFPPGSRRGGRVRAATTRRRRSARWRLRPPRPARSSSARTSAPSSRGCATRSRRAACWAPRCCGSSGAGPASRSRRSGGGGTAWSRSPPTTCRPPPRSCPAQQVTDRLALGLLARPEAEERAEAAKALDDWLGALVGEGLLPSRDPDRRRVHRRAVRLPGPDARPDDRRHLAEAAGETRSQNMPGTTTEYPNWKLPLCGPDGEPVLLEDLSPR